MPPQRRPIGERLAAKLDKQADGCWLWTGSTNAGARTRGGPYGVIGTGGRGGGVSYVHRVAYELEHGAIPAGMHIDHLCRRTLCCNPLHLQPVAPAVNNARSQSPTALNLQKEACPRGHAYDEANTGYRKGTTWRYCRACAREAQRARRDHGLTYPEWLAAAAE